MQHCQALGKVALVSAPAHRLRRKHGSLPLPALTNSVLPEVTKPRGVQQGTSPTSRDMRPYPTSQCPTTGKINNNTALSRPHTTQTGERQLPQPPKALPQIHPADTGPASQHRTLASRAENPPISVERPQAVSPYSRAMCCHQH